MLQAVTTANDYLNPNLATAAPFDVDMEILSGKYEPTFLINLNYLKTFSGGDKIFEKDIIDSSMAEMDEKIFGLKQALQTADRHSIMGLAHSLKSLSSIVGSIHLYNYFKVIEATSADAPAERLQQLEGDAWAIFGKVKEALQTILETEYN